MHRLGTSPRIPAREILLVAFGALVLVLISHWPLPAHMSSAFSRDLGDPIVQAWQVAWGGQALATQPFSYFQANMFWPLPDSLAFSDALVGYAPTGLIGEGVRATTFRYNALFLFSYWLAFMGAYLLARELGVKWWAAVVAGTAEEAAESSRDASPSWLANNPDTPRPSATTMAPVSVAMSSISSGSISLAA